MQLGVSVIVCCYNSAERLPQTIKHLALQRVPSHIPWEIIVIDNASTDNTGVIADQEWNKYSKQVKFRVIKQPVAGLSYAREKGIENAQYEYMLFCDDDNWLYNDYISKSYEIMTSDPQIGAVGGCGIFEPEQPAWFEVETHKIAYVNGPQTWAKTEHWVYGAGSVYRKSIFITLRKENWRQITTGRLGNKLISGEDVEICFMIYLLGYKIISDDKLLFKHFVPIKRQNINYILNLHYWQSYTNVLLNSYYPILNHDERQIEKIINGWYWITAKTFLKQKVKCFFVKKPLTFKEKINYHAVLGTFAGLRENRERIIEHHNELHRILASVLNTIK
ncbi:glycosyltransferase [Mucilaginibacter segetis]|uniref:Glycosyltransferase family 2 protein n=1 Tax=Mucilaginibacter segetis TaxID=2793071 RepID=A0A934ULQ6_9SPHI|nr:glycosyltransferase [Mucilaginibacter segetis]MBK0378205.1 glycosyltransferase family 2 protein [Mucilaginibacter segetis]